MEANLLTSEPADIWVCGEAGLVAELLTSLYVVQGVSQNYGSQEMTVRDQDGRGFVVGAQETLVGEGNGGRVFK